VAPARTILCIDLDAFYVSVERLKRPELVGRPVVVGAHPGSRGVVCAASYEVRKFGVRSAMPISEAERRLRGVPDVVWLAPSHDEYGSHSARVRAVIDSELPVVEAASIDEFYGDATGLGAPRGRAPGPLGLAEHIALKIRTECGLPASIGIATSKLVAKIATDEAKPSGALHILPGREAAYLAGLPVERIPGIGAKTAPHLHRIGVREIGDVARVPAAAIEAALGPHGAAWLRDAAAGIDESPVAERDFARSIGHEETFERDVATAEEIDAIATDLADRVAYRLRAEDLAARTVQVKLRYSARRRRFVDGLAARDVYETITRAATGDATSDGREIAARARALLHAHWRLGEPVRLLGVSCSHLGPAGGTPRQGLLFEEPTRAADERGKRLNRTLDELRDRFGFESIAWGSALLRPGSGP
jgi:DNA polymerase-4